LETAKLARIGWKKPGFIDLNPRLLAEVGVDGCIGDKSIPQLATIRSQEIRNYTIHHHFFRTRPFGSVEDHRFWIAHELAHTFWYSRDSVGMPLSPHQRAIGSDPTIEWLCNRAAAAILVPKGLLEAILREEGYKLNEETPPLHLIPSFARKLRVPQRLLARRWFHDILGIPKNILCVESDRGINSKQLMHGRFRISWEAIYTKLAKLPKKLQGRIVDFSYESSDNFVGTSRAKLDGRWRKLIDQARSTESESVPFSRIPKKQPIDADIAFIGKLVILSFND
jgi:hypothetical protein